MNNSFTESKIADEAALNELYGAVNPNSLAKEVPELTPAYHDWIERAPFMAIASIGEGGLDCSPRGDAPGQLFRVLDNGTIAIPDRRGNNRLDTLRNIVNDPRISLLFLLPGVNETLRINGEATLVTDAELRNSFSMNNQIPVSVIVVNIGSVYFQCARALMRSQLWAADNRQNTPAPTAGEMTKSALPEFDSSTYDEQLLERQRKSLY